MYYRYPISIMEFENLEAAKAAFDELSTKFEQVQKTAEARKQDRIDLEKKLADVTKKLEGFDVDEYKRLQEEASEREQKQLEEEGKYQELLQKRDEVANQLRDQIKQLKTEKADALKQQEDAIAASLGREKELHLSTEFVRAGGNPSQVRNFLLASSDRFKYEVGEDGAGNLALAEALLDKDNKEVTAPDAAMKLLSETEDLGIFFLPKNGSDSGRPAGGSAGNETSNDKGFVWV